MATLDLDEGGWTTATEQSWQAPKHSWREDKKTSLADWSIVLDMADGGTKRYDVHKILLGTGERSSALFSRIFNRTITTAENQNSVSASNCTRALNRQGVDFRLCAVPPPPHASQR